MRKLLTFFALLLSLCPAGAQRWRDVAFKTTPQGDLTLDVYRSDNGAAKRPVFLFIHGGSWKHGDKNEIQGGTFQKFLLERLLQSGYCVVSINYRLVNGPSVRYPEPLQDCRDAVTWIFRHASDYGFDTQRLAIGGASAGAHLAMLTSYAPILTSNQGERITCCVDFYGPTDLGKLLQANLIKPAVGMAGFFGISKETLELRETLLMAFTGENANHPNRRSTKCQYYSPITYTGMAVPTFIAHGTADGMVPFSQSQRLQRDLAKSGVATDFFVVNDADHCFPKMTPAEAKKLTDRILTFLNKYNQ